MDSLCRVSEEIRNGLASARAVVALESTVISHGLPYPANLDVARRMEQIIREHGALPATIALLDGRLCVGVSDQELEYLATAQGIRKISRRDLPVALAQGADGATTVAATATIASWAGIQVFATGGVGGVHRTPPFDISNDLPTLATVPVAVVCAGAKSILDLRATLEWLETAGVPVLGYGTSEFPAFYSRHGGLPVTARVDSAQGAAAIIRTGRRLGLSSGFLVAVPIPASAELPAEELESAITAALAAAEAQGISGSATTPFLLQWIASRTGGASVRANIALLENNAAVAAQISVALAGEGPAENNREGDSPC